MQDDFGRENEGDLILPASMATTEALAFVVRHGTGIVCVALTDERCTELELPPMTAINGDPKGTAFTVSCDLTPAFGITTGVSAADRAKTIKALADPATKPSDLNRPGHIFPLRSQRGGVLQRNGHTEAAVDLARLAGQAPAGLLCEIVRDDGAMARLADCRELAESSELPLISVADLQRYRCAHELVVTPRASQAAGGSTEWSLSGEAVDASDGICRDPAWTSTARGTAPSAACPRDAAASVLLTLDCPQAPGVTITVYVARPSEPGDAKSAKCVLGQPPTDLKELGDGCPPIQAWFSGPKDLLLADIELQPSAYASGDDPIRVRDEMGESRRLSTLAQAMLRQSLELVLKPASV